ncbi:MAG: ABC transporter ATP-binding protein [Spirochaeta sp.]|nr:ABC transporter ATP-binding protein [Spirochaeta sp.]
MDTIVARTYGLSKWYGAGLTRVSALRDVNVTIEDGEFVAVIGPSGSGKSTLLHMLGGIDQPSSGRVEIDRQDLYGIPERRRAILRRRKLGFVFQSFNLLPRLSVWDNIALPLFLDGRPQDPAVIREIVERVGLDNRTRHFPTQLSGGEQQRVAIARALVYRPSLVLADEPTGNLDRRSGREILSLLKSTTRFYRRTLVLVTHDPDLASEADRIITIRDGIVADDRRVRT